MSFLPESLIHTLSRAFESTSVIPLNDVGSPESPIEEKMHAIEENESPSIPEVRAVKNS